MSNIDHLIIAQSLNMPLGNNGLAPALQKWGPVLRQRNAFQIITEACKKQYKIDLPKIIEGPLFLEFITDVLRGAQQVHNDYGVSFDMLGLRSETMSYDGTPTDAIYTPETNTVYISAKALEKYQAERNKEKAGKGGHFGTPNLPNMAFPYRQSPLVLGLEEALHAVKHLRPDALPKYDASAPLPVDILGLPAEAIIHASRPEERAIREPMLSYAKKLKLGPYSEGQAI